jgi:thioredoxin-dependent peroxiredoxin
MEYDFFLNYYFYIEKDFWMKINFLKVVGCIAACSMTFGSFAAVPNVNKTNQAVVSKSKVLPVDDSSRITFLGKPVQISSKNLALNKKVPQVELVTPDLKTIKVGGTAGKIQVIASIVSVNTPVCAKEVIDLNNLAKSFPKAQFIVVSKGLPFTMGSYAKRSNIKNIQLASSFRNDNFGSSFGTLITGGVLKDLNTRAVFVINAEGDLVYKEMVSEIATPPNYETLKLAIKSVYSAPKAAS